MPRCFKSNLSDLAKVLGGRLREIEGILERSSDFLPSSPLSAKLKALVAENYKLRRSMRKLRRMRNVQAYRIAISSHPARNRKRWAIPAYSWAMLVVRNEALGLC
ncbi:hypothetical protein ABW19_dt0207428 [Dactylella cylindrospora]|nr:hypothetical protein ABW19_dt0207428 [Dactylella cylindrospora]